MSMSSEFKPCFGAWSCSARCPFLYFDFFLNLLEVLLPFLEVFLFFWGFSCFAGVFPSSVGVSPLWICGFFSSFCFTPNLQKFLLLVGSFFWICGFSLFPSFFWSHVFGCLRLCVFCLYMLIASTLVFIRSYMFTVRSRRLGQERDSASSIRKGIG